jgi:hypothetical protein
MKKLIKYYLSCKYNASTPKEDREKKGNQKKRTRKLINEDYLYSLIYAKFPKSIL